MLAAQHMSGSVNKVIQSINQLISLLIQNTQCVHIILSIQLHLTSCLVQKMSRFLTYTTWLCFIFHWKSKLHKFQSIHPHPNPVCKHSHHWSSPPASKRSNAQNDPNPSKSPPHMQTELNTTRYKTIEQNARHSKFPLIHLCNHTRWSRNLPCLQSTRNPMHPTLRFPPASPHMLHPSHNHSLHPATLTHSPPHTPHLSTNLPQPHPECPLSSPPKIIWFLLST